MTQRMLSAEIAELARNMQIEDDAVRYLGSLPDRVAVLTALKAADAAAAEWAVEKQLMLDRDDPRPVYLFTSEETYWLAATVKSCKRRPAWASCDDQHLRNLYKSLPADVAAYVSYKIAYWLCRRAGLP